MAKATPLQEAIAKARANAAELARDRPRRELAELDRAVRAPAPASRSRRGRYRGRRWWLDDE